MASASAAKKKRFPSQLSARTCLWFLSCLLCAARAESSPWSPSGFVLSHFASAPIAGSASDRLGRRGTAASGGQISSPSPSPAPAAGDGPRLSRRWCRVLFFLSCVNPIVTVIRNDHTLAPWPFVVSSDQKTTAAFRIIYQVSPRRRTVVFHAYRNRLYTADRRPSVTFSSLYIGKKGSFQLPSSPSPPSLRGRVVRPMPPVLNVPGASHRPDRRGRIRPEPRVPGGQRSMASAVHIGLGHYQAVLVIPGIETSRRGACSHNGTP